MDGFPPVPCLSTGPSCQRSPVEYSLGDKPMKLPAFLPDWKRCQSSTSRSNTPAVIAPTPTGAGGAATMSSASTASSCAGSPHDHAVGQPRFHHRPAQRRRHLHRGETHLRRARGPALTGPPRLLHPARKRRIPHAFPARERRLRQPALPPRRDQLFPPRRRRDLPAQPVSRLSGLHQLGRRRRIGYHYDSLST